MTMRFSSALAAASVLVAVALSACAHGSPTPVSPAPAEQGPLVPAGEAKVGDKTKCIVSGDVFTVTADSPHADYNGKTYYFCCPHCPQEFAKDPGKYVPRASPPAT